MTRHDQDCWVRHSACHLVILKRAFEDAHTEIQLAFGGTLPVELEGESLARRIRALAAWCRSPADVP